MHFSTKKHFEKQPQPRFYTGKVSNSTSIKNITARQANFFLKPIKLPRSIYIYIYHRIHGPKLYFKNKKEKGIGSDFLFRGGGNCHCPSIFVFVFKMYFKIF